MKLNDILNKEIINLEVEGKTKKEVLCNMTKTLKNAGYIVDSQQFLTDIYIRENEGPTGMGHYISIPHGKSKSAHRIGIAIGKCKNMVTWESGISETGYQETNIIFLFCVTANQEFAENHMLLLSELAGKLGNDARIAKIQSAKNKEEVIEALICCDDELGEFQVEENEEIVDLDIHF